MSNHGAPDSWEQQADSGTGDNPESKDMSTKFSTLNVNAAEFVPSFSFVPPPSEETPPQSEPNEKAESPVLNGCDEESGTTPAATVREEVRKEAVGGGVAGDGLVEVTEEEKEGGGEDAAAPGDPPPPPLPPLQSVEKEPKAEAAMEDILPEDTAEAEVGGGGGEELIVTEEGGLVDSECGSEAAILEDPPPLHTDLVAAEESESSFPSSPRHGGEDGGGAEGETPPPADSWEAAALDSDPPSGASGLGEEDDEIIAKPKKKPPRPEETRSKKEHVNVVIIGHVDAGKSTIGGQIMALTGMVDKRTLEKYEREAKERSRESWYLSWALDTNQEEREKGKTVEVGRAYFETEKKHFTILDAPGHKSFVPNMIGGAAQADLAVLVISARKGEFETGFDRGGQTREHAMLAKTAGVKHLVVLINKMDDPTVLWSEERYNECKDKILPYLKKLGFNPAKDLTFMPVSGQTGLGLKDPLDPKLCSWFRGDPFITFIDSLPSLNRKMDGPFLMPVVEKYKDMGTVVMGKVESGEMKKGQSLIIMPNRTPVVVDQVWSDDEEVTSVGPGENIKVKLKGVEEEDVSPGFVLCDPSSPARTGRIFDAQIVILEHKSIICAGYSAVMHIHCVAEEVTVKALICLIDKKTGEKTKTRPRFVKQDQVAIMRIECAGVVCMEQFKLFPQMGRFTLRDEGKTIAIGKVLKIIE